LGLLKFHLGRHLNSVLVAAGLVSVFVAIAPQAQAASFSRFTFDTNVTGTSTRNGGLDPKKSINLQSIEVAGKTLGTTDLALVKNANILVNDTPKDNLDPLGPSSSDHGDKVQGCHRAETPTNAGIVASLGNFNLNCIVDTEDNHGQSVIDVFFDPLKSLNSFFLFERGMNSDLQVEGLDKNGNVISSNLIKRGQWASAGYAIDTQEIGSAQNVGSYGLRSSERLFGLRLTSNIGFNGPDFKVVAAHVPEPTAMFGLGVVSGAAWLTRRRKQAKG
jgi:hypothetical protein